MQKWTCKYAQSECPMSKNVGELWSNELFPEGVGMAMVKNVKLASLHCLSPHNPNLNI